MSEKFKCPADVWGGSGWMHSHKCGRTAAHEHEGKHYCKTHHPPSVAAKDKGKRDARDAKYRASQEIQRKAKDAREEQARRADCFPDLLEALQEIARNDPFHQSSAGIIARAAIQKATGEPS